MDNVRRDMTLLPNLSAAEGRVDPGRRRLPVYVDLLPPCNAACPAGENIQEYLKRLKEGRGEEAWRMLTRDNPFPAVHGRVCYHPCETDCNRKELDGAVSIHAVERRLGDLALEKGWRFERPAERSGRRVLVVGAGPSGLSAAYHLAVRGHDVEIRDAGEKAGGMMRYGIPEYRLPRDVLDAEIARLADDLGVVITLNHKVEDLAAEMEQGNFDAVFIAVGAHLSKKVDIPTSDAERIMDATTFLRSVGSGDRPAVAGRVTVYGGGNTAMDAARVAKRLGAEETVVVYRRTADQMPAHEAERLDAEAEGVEMHWLRTITAVDEELTVEVMELDENGRARGTGRFEKLDSDMVILAVGQDADTEFLKNIEGLRFDRDVLQVDPETLSTDVPGIFAGGDAVPSDRTVTIGTGHGKRAARSIDAYLRSEVFEQKPKHPLASFDKLHPWYFGDATRRTQPELDPVQRIGAFTEVVGGLTDEQALFEAARCLSCGNCFECDGCLGSCPEDAVIKMGKGYRYKFDYDRCTGCATCYDQCPAHAIDMFPAASVLDGTVISTGRRTK